MYRNIKSAIALLFCLYLSVIAFAQDTIQSVHTWKAESKKLGEGKYEILFSAPASGDWKIYAPNQVLLDVKTTELSFADSAIKQEGDFITDAKQIKEEASSIFENTRVKLFSGDAQWKAIVDIEGTVPEKLQGTLLYTYGKNDEFYPATAFSFTVSLEGGVATTTQIKVASIDLNNTVNDCGDEGTTNKSTLSIFLLGILGGLIALLTPCVFPMIPVTVTFFTKKSHDKKKGVTNAVLYGLFIFLIYILITLPFHVANTAISPEIFNNISTNVWLNIIFFAVFVFFALSFFGLFEIGLPAGLANKMDSKSGLGNIGGIFFMAATLAIVSFSCTGPILGTLLVGVAEQGAWPLTAGAAGFGLALGLPFALVRHVSSVVAFIAQIGWMDDRRKSDTWFFRTGSCH